MKIGIDIDGVILDYERVTKTKAELYDFIDLKKDGPIVKDESKVQKRYDWTTQELEYFINTQSLINKYTSQKH